MEIKICKKCKVEKEIIEFNYHNSIKHSLQHYCNKCEKEYKENNKIASVKYEKERKKTDPVFKLTKDIVKYIRLALLYNKSGIIRENSNLRQILGCTLKEFKTHLESQFEPWMNWDNRGLYNGQLNHGWDIDHIIPKATAKTKEEVIKLNHYTNLRPRCSYINRVTDRIKKI
jgi:hypothetical protein